MKRAILVTLLSIGSAITMAQMPDQPFVQHSIPQVGTIALPAYFERVWRTPTNADQNKNRLETLIRIQHQQQPARFVAQPPRGQFKMAPSESIAYLVQAVPKDASPFSQIALLDTSQAALTAYDQNCRQQVASLLPADQAQIESWTAPRLIKANALTYECQYRIGQSELHTIIALLCLDSEKVYHIALTGPQKNIAASRELLVQALLSFTPTSSSDRLPLESKHQPTPSGIYESPSATNSD